MNYRNSRRRRQALRRMLLRCGIAAAAVFLIALSAVLFGNATWQESVEENTAVFAQETEPPTSEAPTAEAQDAVPAWPETEGAAPVSAEIQAEPAEEPTAPVISRASLRPAAGEGRLPVFKKADTEEKIIAVTVDDCYHAENLRKILDLALEYDGKLTFFPIGEQVMRNPQCDILKKAWEAGMELENHTYTHNGLYGCDDATLAKEIYIQNYALSYILGGEYKCHFLRPKGGDARNDQRIHAYISQFGYYGVAHWSVSGRSSKLKSEIAPGNIYLFHTTDHDLQVLEAFIPYVTEQGYKLVTLNEMFGYEPNEFIPMEIPKSLPEVPPLEDYEIVYGNLKKGSYSYSVYRLQERLNALGYGKDTPDGAFGAGTEETIKRFQKKAGMKADGVATVELQELLFSDSAPKA